MKTVIALVALAVAAAGCAPPVARTAAGEGWRATLTWEPPTLAAMRPATLTLKVTAAGGAPVDIEGLEVAAVMPEMAHGADAVAFVRTGRGTYQARHTFSMDGRWEIRLRGSLPHGRLDGVIALDVGR